MEAKATIIFCDSIVNNMSNGRITPSILRPLTNIIPRNIPGNYTFAVFFSIENISLGNHKLHIVLNDTKGNILFDTNDIELNPSLNTVGDYYAPIEISAEVRNAVIENDGEITAIVYLDGNNIGSQKLEVIKQ